MRDQSAARVRIPFTHSLIIDPHHTMKGNAMPLNPDAVGSKSEPVETSWTSKDALLYAVGIGAGRDELAFTTENTNGVDQLVFPTFPVVIGWGRGSAMGNIGTFNPALLVHGQQAVTLHRPIPVSGTATITSEVTGMLRQGQGGGRRDRGRGGARRRAAVHEHHVGVHPRRRRLGRRPRSVRPARTCRPSAIPITSSRYQTSPDQAFVYRLSGDRNPLHTDPSFAAMGGFDRPILHGLCSYGFTGRALLHSLCGSDPANFQHIEARFAAPVLPGDALTIRMWTTGDGESVFTTSAVDPADPSTDRVVIDQGLLRHT